MAITGNKRADRSDYQKMVGLFEAKVLAFNPTREELEELLGTEVEKDPEYFNPEHEIKDENGAVIGVCKQLNVSVWLQDVKTEGKFNVRFFLTDRNRKNKNGDKYQYMNKDGMSSWAADPDTLQEWFKEVGGIRIAKHGEAEFYDFLRSWLLIDFKNDPEAELVLDWARLMRNDVRELRDALGSDLAGTVLCVATIRTVDGDNGPVEYQSVDSRNFLPGSYIKAFRMRGRKAPKALEKFIKECNDPEYGIRDYFVMEELKPYNPEANLVASAAVHAQASGAPATSEAPDDLSY